MAKDVRQRRTLPLLGGSEGRRVVRCPPKAEGGAWITGDGARCKGVKVAVPCDAGRDVWWKVRVVRCLAMALPTASGGRVVTRRQAPMLPPRVEGEAMPDTGQQCSPFSSEGTAFQDVARLRVTGVTFLDAAQRRSLPGM